MTEATLGRGAMVRQSSLFEFFGRQAVVIADPASIYGAVIRDAIRGSESTVALERSHVYVGVLEGATLLKRKYFVAGGQYLLAEGLTHSDYFITWEGLDPSGLGVGRRLVDEGSKFYTQDIDDRHPVEIYDECIFLGGDTITEPNFAHWIFEHLLKLRALEIAGCDLSLPVVVSNRLPRRFLEWGDHLVGRSLNWHRIDLSAPLLFRRTYLSSCPAYRKKHSAIPTVWDEGFDYLHSRFVSVAMANQRAASLKLESRVLFLSRARARWRRAINEFAIFDQAASVLGAVRIDASELPILEQVFLASQAQIIVTFAGADGPLVNFCTPRATVVEITAPKHGALYTCFVFCVLRGVKYVRVVATRFCTPVIGPHPLDADYEVDLTETLKVFTELRGQLRG